jgi:hypothetical protein
VHPVKQASSRPLAAPRNLSPLPAQAVAWLAGKHPAQRTRDCTSTPLLVDMEAIVRRQDQERCASITSMIRHYVARRAQVTEGHPHNAEMSALVNGQDWPG